MQSIRNLSKSLTGLNKSLGSVNASGIQKYANELQKVVSAFDSLNSKTSGLSTGMQRVSESLSSIGKVDFKETGVNSFINAMNRLAKIDMSNFDTSKLGSMVSSLSALANIPNVSSGVNRFVSSVAKLAGTGDSIGTVSKEITSLADGLKRATEKMSIDKDIDKEKDNKLIVSKDTICQTDVRRVIEEWNKLQEVGINPIRDIKPSSKRCQLLKGRIREYGIDEVLNAINNVRKSDFLRGENNRGWMITFDWFVKPNNFLKTLEGNYNKEGQHGTCKTVTTPVKPLIPFDQWNGSDESDTPFAD